jgi:hypothetical protein
VPPRGFPQNKGRARVIEQCSNIRGSQEIHDFVATNLAQFDPACEPNLPSAEDLVQELSLNALNYDVKYCTVYAKWVSFELVWHPRTGGKLLGQVVQLERDSTCVHWVLVRVGVFFHASCIKAQTYTNVRFRRIPTKYAVQARKAMPARIYATGVSYCISTYAGVLLSLFAEILRSK